jgi:hypothetical protein
LRMMSAITAWVKSIKYVGADECERCGKVKTLYEKMETEDGE